MSDQQIFLIGAIATVLVLVHLAIHIVQFRKMDRSGERMTREIREEKTARIHDGDDGSS